MIKEACVETFDEAVRAEKNGAGRIELCSDLKNDGLTPSFELMQKTCSTLNIPVFVMIRPRAGDFVYSDEEVATMENEIVLAKKAGASGVVLGLLTAENEIDIRNTGHLAMLAKPLPVTFNKAIDLLQNPVNGVIELLNVENIKRILTSGGKPTAREGAGVLRNMIKTSGNKITIVVAGKVTNENIDEIEKITGAFEFHGRKIVGDLSIPSI